MEDTGHSGNGKGSHLLISFGLWRSTDLLFACHGLRCRESTKGPIQAPFYLLVGSNVKMCIESGAPQWSTLSGVATRRVLILCREWHVFGWCQLLVKRNYGHCGYYYGHCGCDYRHCRPKQLSSCSNRKRSQGLAAVDFGRWLLALQSARIHQCTVEGRQNEPSECHLIDKSSAYTSLVAFSGGGRPCVCFCCCWSKSSSYLTAISL